MLKRTNVAVTAPPAGICHIDIASYHNEKCVIPDTPGLTTANSVALHCNPAICRTS